MKSLIVKTIHNQTTDAFAVGYPKTGNTWLQVMLGKYLHLMLNGEGKMPLFSSYDKLHRCRRFHPDFPRMAFTHSVLEWDSQSADDLSKIPHVAPYKTKTVLLLVRFLPDVLVSHFHHVRGMSNPPYEKTIGEMMDDPFKGIEKYLEFYRQWEKEKDDVQRIRLVRYEDLRENPAEQLKAILLFLGVPVDEQRVVETVDFSSFQNMRKMEEKPETRKELVYESSGLPIFATGDVQKNREAYHVRKGKVGGYREYLSDSQISYLHEKVLNEMPNWYGYDESFIRSLSS